jgi:uncharacterized protein YbjQ (UPF0145 family)
MKLSTLNNIPDKEYEVIGLVNGMQVRSLNLLRSALSGVASIFGTGKENWTGVTNKYKKGSNEALDDMMKQAKKLKADEIIGISFQTSQLSTVADQGGMLVMTVYGTAIKYKEKKISKKKIK